MHDKTVKGNIKTISTIKSFALNKRYFMNTFRFPSENIFQKKSFDSIVNTILCAINEKYFTSSNNMPITLNKLPQKQ